MGEGLAVTLDQSTPKFACPACGHYQSKVINTRSEAKQDGVRRRRACLACGHRFTTEERTIQTAEKSSPRKML